MPMPDWRSWLPEECRCKTNFFSGIPAFTFEFSTSYSKKHHHQPSTELHFGGAVGIPVTTNNKSSMDVQGVSLSTASSHDMQGVSLSIARMDMQGVSLSTASGMDVQGVSLFTASNMGVEGVSLSTTSSATWRVWIVSCYATVEDITH
jgi:hypothetical protein